MRVLLVDLETDWRGGQSQALLLLQGLRARGHAVELLSVTGAALAERAGAAGIAVHAAPSSFRRAQATRMLRRFVAERRFDVVHANEAHSLTAAWLARVHHSVPVVAARRVLFPLRRSVISLARYRAAACVIAVSTAVRSELLAAGLDAQRIEMIPDGVEPVSPISREERMRARADWGLPADAPVAGYVASFTAEKGHALLLDAFAIVRRSIPSCHLVLVGSGPLQQSLEERARTAGTLLAVHFRELPSDFRSGFAAFDVFLFSSLREGLGSALLAAMGYGLPVVALSGGSIGDVLEEGRNGLISAPSPEALAAAAMRLFTDEALARRLGEAGRNTIAVRFSTGAMVGATEGVYQRLLASR